MIYSHIMVRFGELSTKGKNKKQFIKTLARNIRGCLSDFPGLKYDIRFDHIYVNLGNEDPMPIIEILQDVSGIHSMSLVFKTEDDLENLKNVSLELIKQEEGTTFKVVTKRANKKYPLISDQINREIAGHVLRNTNLKVDVHNPDIKLCLDIREEGAYVFCHTYKGCGGYPLGSGGKVMHMLSGGIDSPVAAYLLMKRGMKIECIHFASPPYTNAAVIDKLKDLLKQLNKYQPDIRLNIIPFTKLQETIYKEADESYAITLMRRMMFRLADELAKHRNCLAISTGESIGQVASQTLESMGVINAVTNMPIIRPLCVMDKEDIIILSKKINCFDISIRPYEDCCTIFDPKNPKTKPSLKHVLEYEAKFNYEELINEALDNVEVINVSKNEDDLMDIFTK